jgi:hypothetical protein
MFRRHRPATEAAAEGEGDAEQAVEVAGVLQDDATAARWGLNGSEEPDGRNSG